MATNVKVAGVKRLTSPYPCHEFSFEQDGEIRTKKVYTSKNRDLADVLDALSVGEEVAVSWRKNDKGFYEVAGISRGNAANTPAKKTYQKTTTTAAANSSTAGKSHSFADNAIGQQVGNALTNAVNSLGGQKVTIAQIEQRAWELVLLGERLKKRIADGEHNKDNVVPGRDISLEGDGFETGEEDIPF